MLVWTVQAKPPVGSQGPKVVLVRDGFSWGALLLPVVWFLAKGLIALAAMHAALIMLLGAVLPTAALPFVLAGIQVFLGFEARNLRGRWLELRGYRQEAVLMARDEDVAVLNLASFRPDLARWAV